MADTLFQQKERYKSVNKYLQAKVVLSDSIAKKQAQAISEKEITEASYKKEAKKKDDSLKILKPLAKISIVVAILEAGWIALTAWLSK